MKKILFASKNKGKIIEVSDILKDCNIELISLLDFKESPHIDETGTTFEENAKIKAKIAFEIYNIPAIADDSGIEVEQLGWKPGVYSARYAGNNSTDDLNNNKLISELKNFPEPHNARYACCSVYYDGGEFGLTFGEISGRITTVPRGKNGFGYDPYFIPDGYAVTMAELMPNVKNSISHRFKAFSLLKKLIK